MNPTLAERLRRQQRQRYWRTHPPAPFLVPPDPPTALLYSAVAGGEVVVEVEDFSEGAAAFSEGSAEFSDSAPAPVAPVSPVPVARVERVELIQASLELLLWLIDGFMALRELAQRRSQRAVQAGNGCHGISGAAGLPQPPLPARSLISSVSVDRFTSRGTGLERFSA